MSFTYRGDGFLETVGNASAGHKSPTPTPVKVEIKEPKKSKKPTVVQLDKKSVTAIAQNLGTPYYPQSPRRNIGKKILSHIPMSSHYMQNREADNRENFRDKELKESEKQTELLKEISDKKNSSKSSVNFLGRGFLGKGMLKLAAKITALALILKNPNKFLSKISDAYSESKKKIADEKGVAVEDLGITSKARAAIDMVGDAIVGEINNIAGYFGVKELIPPNIVPDTTKKMSDTIDEWGANLIANTESYGQGIVDLLTNANSLFGKAISGVSDTVMLLDGMKNPLDNAIQAGADLVTNTVDYLDEIQDYFRKQSPEEKGFRKDLEALRETEDKYKGKKLSEKEEKEIETARAKAKKSGQIALDSGMSKTSGIYNDAKALNNDKQALIDKAKREQKRLQDMTRGIAGNNSIFGVGGNSNQDIEAQKNKRDEAFIKMFEEKQKTKGLSKREAEDYMRAKKGNTQRHLDKATAKRSETLDKVIDLKTLKKEVEEGSILAKAKLALQYTSKEQLDAEIKKSEAHLRVQDNIIDTMEQSLEKLEKFRDSIKIQSEPTPTATTKGGISNKSTMEYEGFRNHIYKDSKGLDTIGYGHLLTADDKKTGRYNNGITKEEAKKLFDKDKVKHDKQLYNKMGWIKDQPKEVRKALEDMAFNMGVGNGKNGLSSFKNTLSLVKQGRYEEASKAILKSKYAKDVGQRAIDNANRIKNASKAKSTTRTNTSRIATSTKPKKAVIASVSQKPTTPKPTTTKDTKVKEKTKEVKTEVVSKPTPKVPTRTASNKTDESGLLSELKKQTAILEKGTRPPIVLSNKSTNGKEVSI